MPSDQFGRDLEEDLGYDLDLLREEEDEYLEEKRAIKIKKNKT